MRYKGGTSRRTVAALLSLFASWCIWINRAAEIAYAIVLKILGMDSLLSQMICCDRILSCWPHMSRAISKLCYLSASHCVSRLLRPQSMHLSARRKGQEAGNARSNRLGIAVHQNLQRSAVSIRCTKAHAQEVYERLKGDWPKCPPSLRL